MDVSKPHKHQHNPTRRILHWSMAFLIFGLLVLGAYLVRVHQINSETQQISLILFSTHKTVGILVFALAIVRLLTHYIWPPLSHPHSVVEQFAAKVIHQILLLTVLAMPMVGLMIHLSVAESAPLLWGVFDHWRSVDAERAETFAQLHSTFAFLIIICLGAHIGGALKHHFWDKDQTLVSMIDGREFDVISNSHSSRQFPTATAIALLILSFTTVGVFFSGSEKAAVVADGAQTEWVVEPAKSKLRVKADASGMKIDAEFRRFNSTIIFQPDNLDAARIEITIDTASFQSGVSTVDETVQNSDWLFSMEHPTAHWRSQKVRRTEDGSYVADGLLTIREKSAPLALKFELNISNGNATAIGSATFDRRDLLLGRGEASGEDIAMFPIEILFTIYATIAPS